MLRTTQTPACANPSFAFAFRQNKQLDPQPHIEGEDVLFISKDLAIAQYSLPQKLNTSASKFPHPQVPPSPPHFRSASSTKSLASLASSTDTSRSASPTEQAGSGASSPEESLSPAQSNLSTHLAARANSLNKSATLATQNLEFKFDKNGYVNSIRLGAEVANLISRAAVYAGSGAFSGAVLGFCVPFPGMTAVGAAAGALSGLLCGVIVSLVSVLCKPLFAILTRHLKDKGTKNSSALLEEVTQKSNSVNDTIVKIDKLATLFSNCENKMYGFIRTSWLYNKLLSHKAHLDENGHAKLSQIQSVVFQTQGEHFDMRHILKKGITAENSGLKTLMAELESSLPNSVKKCLAVLKNRTLQRQDTTQLINSEAHRRTLQSQYMSYNVTRTFSTGIASQISLPELPSDLSAALYFPATGLASAVIAGSQSSFARKARNFITDKNVAAFNILGIGGVSTVLQFLPHALDIVHNFHNLNILSFVFTMGIHSKKERLLMERDLEIKKQIQLPNALEDSELILNQFARVVRHDLTKNIPSALKSMASLCSEMTQAAQKNSPQLGNLMDKFITNKLWLENFIYHTELYLDYLEV